MKFVVLVSQYKCELKSIFKRKKKKHKPIIGEKKIVVAIVPLGIVATIQKYCTNKCSNIFTRHLFSVVVSHNFIFYYFILTYKKLIPQ